MKTIGSVIVLFLIAVLFAVVYPEIALRGYRTNEKRARDELHFLVNQLDEYVHKNPQHKRPESLKQLALQAKAGSPYDWNDLEARYVYVPEEKSFYDDQPVVIERPGHYDGRVEGRVALGNGWVTPYFDDKYRDLLAKWAPELSTNALNSRSQAISPEK